MKINIRVFVLAVAAGLFASINAAIAVIPSTTAITYQGRLSASGAPANGSYNLSFALFADSNGVTQVGNTLTNPAVAVTNGLFMVTLDFGNGIFNGQPLWLQIGATTNGGSTFTLLSPLQPLTPAPTAIYSSSAATAVSASFASTAGTSSNLVGVLPAAQLPAAVVMNGASGITLSGTFSGDGSGLANVNSTVNNTLTNPLAVGFPTPLPVYDVENPARQAVLYSTNFLVQPSVGNPNRNLVLFTIPPDQKLVIETVSARVEAWNGAFPSFLPPPTNQYQIVLQTALAMPSYTNYIPIGNGTFITNVVYGMVPAYSGFILPEANGLNVPSLTEKTRLYADAGTQILVTCLSTNVSSLQQPITLNLAISGYYVSTNPPASIWPTNFNTSQPGGGSSTGTGTGTGTGGTGGTGGGAN